MKKRTLIVLSAILAILFSALVYSAIRLFNHHDATPAGLFQTSAQTGTAVKKPAVQAQDRNMIRQPEQTENNAKKRETAVLGPSAPEPPPPADSEENRLEMARMQEKLAGNMWLPQDPRFGIDPKRSERLGKSIMLADKIRKGTATVKEKKEYYSFKIKSARDRIDIIKYIADRTAELGRTSKKTYLTGPDRVVGEKKIAQLEKEINGYEELLKKIDGKTDVDSGRQGRVP